MCLCGCCIVLLKFECVTNLASRFQSEGIFRINPENGQEEYVREQLNNGLIPDNIDVHCLAGLIKVLSSLPPSSQRKKSQLLHILESNFMIIELM